MAAGILVCDVNVSYLLVVVARLTSSNESIERTTGIEIIPPEPEQRSYLRREAPSVISTHFLLLTEEP
jgi:hypothetical protein